MELSSKIEKLRKQKGLSQEEFANEMGVSRQSVFKWESGENTPDLDKIKKLASLFNVSFDVLLNDDIELDDEYRISYPKEEKKHKPINKKLVLITLIGFLAVGVITGTTIGIINYVQNKMAEERFNNQISDVISLINNIGEVTLESEDKIIIAEEAYSSLNEEQKQKVSNYQTLVNARTTYDQLAFEDREEKTKDDPTRTITLSNINGHWKSSYDEWKIQDLGNYKSVLYWTSLTPGGSTISTNLKNSYLVGYNNVTQRMEITLYHFYSFGEEFLDVKMTKDENNKFTIYYQDYVYKKIA